MAKPKNRPAAKKPIHREPDPAMDVLDDNDGPMEGPQPLPRIDRRHAPRSSYQTTAWLAPADDTGAVRRPIIRTRDLSTKAMGFRTRQDVSALGEAVLRLPATTGRYIAVACRVRRSKEVGDGWFDCLVEFLQPQPDLAIRHAQLCMQPIVKTSHNNRRRK
jgi:hypothetical protein